MKNHYLLRTAMAVLGAIIIFVPISSWAIILDTYQVIYASEGGSVNPTVLCAKIEATGSGNTLTIVLTNTSTGNTGGSDASNLLTGVGITLPSGYSITGGSADSGSSTAINYSNPYGTNVSGEWGGGSAQGPFIAYTGPNSPTYVAATLKSAIPNPPGDAFDPSKIISNPTHVNGPEFGLLSSSQSIGNGLSAIQSSITLTLTLNAAPADWDSFLRQIYNGPVVVSFGSPTAAVPEPATMLLLGSGLIGLALWGRKMHN